MPDKTIKVHKKRRSSSYQAPDLSSGNAGDTLQNSKKVLAEDAQINKKPKKRKKRRSSQKRQEKSALISRKSFRYCCLILSVTALIIAIAVLRFLHLNGPDYKSVFQQEIREQYGNEIKIEGLAIFPFSMKCATVERVKTIPNIAAYTFALEGVNIQHNGHGLVGLNWKVADFSIDNAAVHISSSIKPDERISNSSFFQTSSTRVEKFKLTTSGNNGINLLDTSLYLSKDKFSLAGGSVYLPYFSSENPTTIEKFHILNGGIISGLFKQADREIPCVGSYLNGVLDLSLQNMLFSSEHFNGVQHLMLGDNLTVTQYNLKGELHNLSCEAKLLGSLNTDIIMNYDSFVSLLPNNKSVKPERLNFSVSMNKMANGREYLTNFIIQLTPDISLRFKEIKANVNELEGDLIIKDLAMLKSNSLSELFYKEKNGYLMQVKFTETRGRLEDSFNQQVFINPLVKQNKTRDEYLKEITLLLD